MSSNWIKTDDLQFVLEKSNTKFDVIDIVKALDGKFYASYREVDIEEEDESNILSTIKSYGYNSVEEIKSIYGSAANQIVAECLAESIPFDSDTSILKGEEEINNWLQKMGCSLMK